MVVGDYPNSHQATSKNTPSRGSRSITGHTHTLFTSTWGSVECVLFLLVQLYSHWSQQMENSALLLSYLWPITLHWSTCLLIKSWREMEVPLIWHVLKSWIAHLFVYWFKTTQQTAFLIKSFFNPDSVYNIDVELQTQTGGYTILTNWV